MRRALRSGPGGRAGTGDDGTAPAAETHPSFLNRLAWSTRWSDPAESVRLAQAALEVSRAGDDRRSKMERGRARRTLAWQACWSGSFDEAMTRALTAEESLPESEHPATRADIYAILATIHRIRNRLDLARSAADRGMLLLDRVAKDSFPSARVALMVADASIRIASGEGARAGIILSRARDHAVAADAAMVEAETAHWLVAECDRTGALDHATLALGLAEKHENRLILPYAHVASGRALIGRDDAEARLALKTAMTLAKAAGDARVECHILCAQGELEAESGDVNAAIKLLRRGAAAASRLRHGAVEKSVALHLAELYETTGDLAAALSQHKIAWKHDAALRR